jgi:arabinofuranosyltransferase
MTILLMALALAGGPAFVRLNLMSDPFPKVREAYNYRHGITDEHAYYRRLTGLGVSDLQSDLARCVWRDAPAPTGGAARKIVQVESTGMHGFRHGPEYYMLDAYALINPLMARLPALRDPNWLPGHLNRLVPPELVRSLREGSNRLTDPALAEYYDRLNLITRGPLLTRARLIEIARMNLGWNASLIDRARYAAPPAAAGPIRRAISAAPLQINRGWNDGGNVFFGARGLTIDLDRPARGVRGWNWLW